MRYLIAICLLVILLLGCVGKEQASEVQLPGNGTVDANVTEETSTTSSQRDFYLGIVPTPKNSPNSTFDDITEAYKETGEIAEISMVWVQPSGIGQYEKLKQNKVLTALSVYGLKPVVTLSFATIKQKQGGLEYVINAPAGVNSNLTDPEFRNLWKQEARNIAQDFKPEYFSLGNEINDYFYLHPEDLDDYISLYDEAYAQIKEVSPNTKVFVVFSYTHMIDNNQFGMIQKFDNRSDLIGLTTYPWKHYDDPEDIPENYYTRLNTTKPIAFTEIGWPSTDSEGEQAEFLAVFLNRTNALDLEMVNWLFLHEMELQGIAASVSDPETGTISLKNKDGSKKKIYDEWIKLKNK